MRLFRLRDVDECVDSVLNCDAAHGFDRESAPNCSTNSLDRTKSRQSVTLWSQVRTHLFVVINSHTSRDTSRVSCQSKHLLSHPTSFMSLARQSLLPHVRFHPKAVLFCCQLTTRLKFNTFFSPCSTRLESLASVWRQKSKTSSSSSLFEPFARQKITNQQRMS